jgi:hypothetical protein
MKLTRTMPDGSALHITAQTDRSYFSVTADWPAQRAGGCLHDEVRSVAPWLAPIIALHLSDAQTGAPMHAEANGFYWVAGVLGGLGQQYHGANDGRHTPGDCLRILADHLRVSRDEAEQVCAKVARTFASEGPKRAREVWRGVVDAMGPTWARQAAEGRALLAQGVPA